MRATDSKDFFGEEMNFLTIDPYLDYIVQGCSTIALPFRETHEEVYLFSAQ
ncbi:MAG: hypothetical protein IT391_02825 [Nitrospira sp.]|nr:hypothetical protein [Nitrospira sp.]